MAKLLAVHLITVAQEIGRRGGCLGSWGRSGVKSIQYA